MKYLWVLLCTPLLTSFRLQPPPLTPKPFFEIVCDRLVMAESQGKPWALSSKGAVGLYQIMPIGLEEYNYIYHTNYIIKEMWDTNINILVGKGILSNLLERYNGEYVKAINSYNMGMGNTKLGNWNYNYIGKITPHLMMVDYYLDMKYKRRVYVKTNNKHKVSSVP